MRLLFVIDDVLGDGERETQRCCLRLKEQVMLVRAARALVLFEERNVYGSNDRYRSRDDQ